MASIALPNAARRGAWQRVRGAAWRRPEWPWVALVVAAWAALMVAAVAGGAMGHSGVAVSSGALGHGHAAASGGALGMGAGAEGAGAGGVLASALPASLGWWAVMVVAMMLPATIPVVRAISFGSMWDRRYRSPALFLVAFVAVWVAFGAIALTSWQLAALLGVGHAIHGAIATGAILLVAANWQLAPQQRRFLKRCHRALALGARGRTADRACAGACWPLMLAMVPGHGVALMAALTGISTWQRVARRPQRMHAACALIAVAAAVMLAG
jgi:predicted metal-binding membrane protein